MVRELVSMIHPRTFLTVDQEQSPARSFFNETGSARAAGSPGVRGRKTSSMACRSVRRTRMQLEDCCAAPIKSSTNTSTYDKGSEVEGKDGSRGG